MTFWQIPYLKKKLFSKWQLQSSVLKALWIVSWTFWNSIKAKVSGENKRDGYGIGKWSHKSWKYRLFEISNHILFLVTYTG